MAAAVQPNESGHTHRASDKTVFIRRLPYNLTDKALEEAVSHIGPVKSCFTVKERDTRKCRGFGYAVFCTREDAERAIKELKHIGGRQVSVSMATRRHRKRKRVKSANSEDNQGENSLRVDKEDGSINGEEDVEDGSNSGEVPSGKVAVSKSQRTHASTAVGRTLVVTGFPEGVTKKQFYKCCRKFGEVEQLDYPIEGRSELTASVVYKTYPDSRKALQKLEGKTFKGATLKAVIQSREGKSPSQKALRKSRLIIRNLSFAATEEDVKSVCVPFGAVHEVNIPRKEGGKKRGFAFVQFKNVFSAGQAMEALNGSEIKGRVVAMDWVAPKDLYETAKDASALSKEAASQEEEEGEEKQLTDSDANEDRGSGPDISDESDMETADWKENDINHSMNEVEGNDSDEDDVASLDSISDDDQDMEEEGEGEGDKSEDESDFESELPDSLATTSQKTKAEKQAHQSNDVKEGKTVFIRNLPFDCDEEDISDTFAEFGKLVYCRQVINRETDIPKGTAFAKYSRPQDAQKCIDASNVDTKGIVLGGRRLVVSMAVSRLEAQSISQWSKEKGGRDEDKRNLYLAKEGQINPDSEVAKGLSKADLSKRVKAAKEKKAKLANPNFFVSKTRLSVRNIPTSVDEKQLKKVFQDGAGGQLAGIKQVKILRDSARQNSSGISRSRGHGFVEFAAHEAALTALRAINNNPELFGPQKRPIVEFAIEDARALKLRADRQLRQKKLRSEMQQQATTQGSHQGGKKPPSKVFTPRKRKDSKGEGGSKDTDVGKRAFQTGKDSKQGSTEDNHLEPDSVEESVPAAKRKKVTKPAPSDGGSKRHTARPQQTRRKKTTKTSPKTLSRPKTPHTAPAVASSSAKKGRHGVSVPPSEIPQQKSRKRRPPEGDMEEHRLNAMIENYKRKVFGSHG